MKCLEIIQHRTCTLYKFHLDSTIFYLYLYPLGFARRFCKLDCTELMWSRNHLQGIEHCESLSFWSSFHPNSFPIFISVGGKSRTRGESCCVISLEQFWREKGSCCVVRCCSFLLSIHHVTVLYFRTGNYRSTSLFVIWWFCLQQYTNTSTLTFVSLR